MFAIWLHTVGARIIALPFRIVIGLIFIQQGALYFEGDSTAVQLLELGEAGGAAAAVALIVAGAASVLGVLVRPFGAVLFVVVVSNLLAGLTVTDANVIVVLQTRALLAMCALVLFFLGSGMLSFDSLIFRGVSSALRKSDKEQLEKAKQSQ